MITEKQADRIIALLERISESVERPTILSDTKVYLPTGSGLPEPGDLNRTRLPHIVPKGLAKRMEELMTSGPVHAAVERDIQYPRGETPHILHVDEDGTLPT